MTSALVLSGGGNLGAVEAGMLLAFEDAGITADVIVGTSVGAINGAWVAGARPAAGLAEIWERLRRSDVFPFDPLGGFLGFIGLRDHLVPLSGLRRLLRTNLPFERLEDAAVPFHVVATNVLSGADVLLSDGPALEAVLASAAIPGVFSPVTIDGIPLMDGGIVNNTPISHAVALGAELIWVLSTGYACALPSPPHSALGMGLHAVTQAIQERLALDVERYAGQVDLRVVPPLCPVTVAPTDFSQAETLIKRARAHTANWLKDRGGHRDAPSASGWLHPHSHRRSESP